MKHVCAYPLLLLLSQLSFAQEPPSSFGSGWTVYGLFSAISAVPVSYTDKTWPPTSAVESSSSGKLIGVGYRFSFDETNWYAEVQADYGYGKFSDWRVKDRGIHYYMIGVNAGYVFADGSPFSLFASFGGGGMVQSEYYDPGTPREDHFNEYEYLGEAEYPIYFGFGFKLALLQHIIVRGEGRFYRIGDSGGYVAGNTYYYNPDAKSETASRIFGVGLEIAF